MNHEPIWSAGSAVGQALLDAFTDPVLLLDKQGIIQAANQATADLLRQVDIVGLDVAHLLPPAVVRPATYRLQLALRRGGSQRFEIQLAGRELSVSLYPQVDAAGELVQTAVFARDITERKRNDAIQMVLFNISQAASTADNLAELTRYIAGELGRLIDTQNFYVALYDQVTGLYAFPFGSDEFDDDWQPQPMPCSLTDYVRRQGRPLLVDEALHQQLIDQGEVGMTGSVSPIWLGAPLKTAHGVSGVVVVQSYSDPNHYTAKDLEILSMVSDTIALVTERKRAEEASRQRAAQLNALRQIGLELVEQRELNRLLRLIVIHAAQLLDSDQGLLFLGEMEGETLQIVATTPNSFLPVGLTLQRGQGIAGQIWQTGEMLLIPNYGAWPGRVPETAAVIGAASVLGVPIARRAEIQGVLTVVGPAERPFAAADAELLRLFAGQAAVAIQNARLLDLVQQHTTDLQLEVIERKRVEQELRQYRHHLEELVAERTQALTEANAQLRREIAERQAAEAARQALIAELESKNAELERFTYTVSHDLKSPLVTVKGFLGYLGTAVAEGDLSTAQADIERIQTATDRMQLLLEDLLQLSRVGRMTNPPQVIPFGELAAEARLLVDGQVQATGVMVEIAADLPAVYGDRPRLVEVVQNLLDNAIKFMGEQPAPHITIGQKPDAAELIFFVRDNGIGIDPRYQEKIFGLFDRLDPAVPGTGVGLALVARIIEIHNGRIWVESAGAGQGTTFYFTLPPAPE